MVYWKRKCWPVGEKLRTEFSKQLLSFLLKFLRENSTFQKVIYRFQTLSEIFFPRGKYKWAGLSKLCSTSPHFEEGDFENILFFFDLRTLSQSVSVSVVKIFNKHVKTAIQMFRWKLSLNFFPKKIPLFIIIVNSDDFFRISGGKVLYVMSKLHSECSEVHSAENVFFLDKLNLICPLWTLRKKGRPFDRKVTAGFSRLRSACPESLYGKHFFWSYIFTFANEWESFALLSDKFSTMYSKW